MDFLKPAKFFFAVSILATVVSIVLLFVPGPRLSIEYTGGTRMEIVVPDQTKTVEDVRSAAASFTAVELDPIANALEDRHFILRTRGITNEQHEPLLTHLKTTLGADMTEVQFTTIGPTVGGTQKNRAVYALLTASLGIVLYLALMFRKIPRRYSPWKFGMVAVITLLHDMMITVGIMTIVSHYTSFEVDTLFVTALLTILGYSVNDTIIVFDRIRDNLLESEGRVHFAELANDAVNQTWKRSSYTSFSTLIMLFALLIFGSESIRWFVTTLVVGIALGTYSSIFVAMPFLVLWSEKGARNR